MTDHYYATIAGSGHYIPNHYMSNDQLEGELGLPKGWIERRTGIRGRYYAREETLTDIAVEAARRAIKKADVESKEIGLVLLATSTPDHLLPPSAPHLAHCLGLTHCGAMDIAGACCGFLNAVILADSFVSHYRKTVLIVAANILSRRLNPVDRNTRPLFGDAAGAVLMRAERGDAEEKEHKQEKGIVGIDMLTKGDSYALIHIPVGGTVHPFSYPHKEEDRFMQFSNGMLLFNEAVATMTLCAERALAAARCSIEEIDFWIPHQANKRILDAVAHKLFIPPEKIISFLAEYGNSSAATIPVCLSCAEEKGQDFKGKTLLMTAVGAGLAGAGIVIRL